MAGEIIVNSSHQDELEIIKKTYGNKVKTVTSSPTETAWSDDVFKELCIKSKPVMKKMPNRIVRVSNALKFFSCYYGKIDINDSKEHLSLFLSLLM